MIEHASNIQGHCYCGSVRFEISAGTVPVLAGYCHCKDCRLAHAAPIYQYVYIDKSSFSITENSELLRWYCRSDGKPGFRRHFCSRCGSRVYNDMTLVRDGVSTDLCGTFPSLFEDQELAVSDTWSPKKHVYCGESIMNLSQIDDGLPKFQKVFK